MSFVKNYGAIIDVLNKKLARLHFSAPVTHVYNPLVYAREPHMDYVARYGKRGARVLWLGMNPGPWGMAQNGVPFGEISIVRDWLGVQGHIESPKKPHPARPIEGMHCTRSEVSGARLWGLAKNAFATPAQFFKHFFVVNYCPLVFMEGSGKNFTPDKLRAEEAAPLYAACDEALRATTTLLGAHTIVGVGAFAQVRAEHACAALPALHFFRMLHPSPASPAANKDWAGAAEKALRTHNLWPC